MIRPTTPRAALLIGPALVWVASSCHLLLGYDGPGGFSSTRSAASSGGDPASGGAGGVGGSSSTTSTSSAGGAQPCQGDEADRCGAIVWSVHVGDAAGSSRVQQPTGLGVHDGRLFGALLAAGKFLHDGVTYTADLGLAGEGDLFIVARDVSSKAELPPLALHVPNDSKVNIALAAAPVGERVVFGASIAGNFSKSGEFATAEELGIEVPPADISSGVDVMVAALDPDEPQKFQWVSTSVSKAAKTSRAPGTQLVASVAEFNGTVIVAGAHTNSFAISSTPTASVAGDCAVKPCHFNGFLCQMTAQGGVNWFMVANDDPSASSQDQAIHGVAPIGKEIAVVGAFLGSLRFGGHTLSHDGPSGAYNAFVARTGDVGSSAPVVQWVHPIQGAVENQFLHVAGYANDGVRLAVGGGISAGGTVKLGNSVDGTPVELTATAGLAASFVAVMDGEQRILWAHVLGLSPELFVDSAPFLSFTAEGDLIVAFTAKDRHFDGASLVPVKGFTHDVCVSKFRGDDGALVWGRAIADPSGDEVVTAVAYDSATRSFYVGGWFTGALNFPDGVRSSAGDRDAFIVRMQDE